MDNRDLLVAIESHMETAPRSDEGRPLFTRRIAITLADMADTPVKDLVLRCERLGYCPNGTWDWFTSNGGITRDHIKQVRDERLSQNSATSR